MLSFGSRLGLSIDMKLTCIFFYYLKIRFIIPLLKRKFIIVGKIMFKNKRGKTSPIPHDYQYEIQNCLQVRFELIKETSIFYLS